MPITTLQKSTARGQMPDVGGPTLVVSLADKQILAAYQDAEAHQNTTAIKMIICGYLLLEKRAAMVPQCHGGTPVKIRENGQFSKNPHGRFDEWIESMGMAKRTAYRWMEAAERVGHCQLNVPLAMDLPACITIGSEVQGLRSNVTLSMALTAPESELPAEALRFRQGVFTFMADKTLSDALNASLDGESPAHRITRAHAGKTKGGKGQQDRKDFDRFATTKLKHLTTFVTVEKKVGNEKIIAERNLTQTQKAIIMTRFTEAVGVWPRWLVMAIVEAGKSELKASDIDRAGRKNPFSGRNA